MNLWDQILARIETKVNRHSFYTWFKPTSFISEDAASITVRVPNNLFKEWLTKHYSGVIAESLAEVKRPLFVGQFRRGRPGRPGEHRARAPKRLRLSRSPSSAGPADDECGPESPLHLRHASSSGRRISSRTRPAEL